MTANPVENAKALKSGAIALMNAGNADLAREQLKKAAGIYLALAEKSTGSIQEHWLAQAEECHSLATGRPAASEKGSSDAKPRASSGGGAKSQKSGFASEKPTIKLDNIGGLEEVKTEMKENIFFPLTNPGVYEEYGISPPKGILLYGPPGTGKTLLCRAFAGEAEATIYLIKGPEVLDKFVGEPERKVRDLFDDARSNKPSIVVFDEIDAVVPDRGMYSGGSGVRETIVNQILTELDGFEGLKGVIVIGTTNRPDILDRAILRPGRFDKLIYVPEPDEKARHEILKIHTKKMPLGDDIDLGMVAKELEGYTGADIEAVCREAAMNVVREKMKVWLAKKDQKEKTNAKGGDKTPSAPGAKDDGKKDDAGEKKGDAKEEPTRKVCLAEMRAAMKKITPTMTPNSRKMYDEIRSRFIAYQSG